MWKPRHERKRDERERLLERLARSNPHYAYSVYKKYQGPGRYEAWIKKLGKEFEI